MSQKFKDLILSQNIQLRDLAKNEDLFKEKKKVYIMCRRGNASKEATEYVLNHMKYSNVYNVEGGIEQVIKEVDDSLPMY